MSEPTDHKFVVTVSGCTKEQAEQVMNERISPDEDYGFEYSIGYENMPEGRFALAINHEFGTDTSVHRDEASAKRHLAEYVREYWENDAAGKGSPPAAEEAPESDDTAISEYFEVATHETYSITPIGN